MQQRQAIIAGEREIAERGQSESERDLARAGCRERRFELSGIDADDCARENERGYGDDKNAKADSKAPQKNAVVANQGLELRQAR